MFGGTLKSFDASKVASMSGVKKVVQVGDSAVAVVADTWWHAKTALEALPVEWDEGENAKVSSEYLADWLKEGLDAEQAFVGNQNGDVRTALADATKKVEAVYSYPFQNHAPMEPMNATVRYTADSCEVWTPTQNGEAALAATAEAAELPVAKCDVHKMLIGGGFGFQMGWSLKLDKVPHNRLHLALAHAFGHRVATFGKPALCEGGPLKLA